MDAAPDGGSLVISSPWADQGAGRIWKVEGVPAGAVDIDEVAVASAGGPEASGFGYALAWGEALLVGAPYGDQVQVLDDQLQPLHVLGGADGLGAWVGWLEDGILEADGVPDVGIIANAATDTFPLQGVALVLDGQQVLDGALPPLADDSEDGALDLDGDGSPATEDCDDADPRRAPGAPEACDGLDNDCDGDTDEDACDGGGGCTTSPTGRGRAGLALLGSALLLAVARQRRGPRGGARRRHLAGLALLFGSLAGCASAPEPPPTLNLRFQDPVDGQPLDPDNLYGDVQLTATGDLARIALVVDGELLAVEDATMVSATWSATDPGAHEVLAEGWDAEGAPLREWRIAHVNAALGDDLAPAVRLTRPVEAEVKVGTELSIAMNVLDDRWIDSATLTVDGALIGQWPEIDAPQWAADVLFPGFEEGPHTIELRARDLAGNEAVDVHELEAVVAN
ncbi:putative metal-binding motif-containing protein [Myxococcota bacterium]|nr:putative metal-binding motif-containing protein [Myxococcota bacterium]